MQSITTKYLPPTNTKGTRYKATCERGSITISCINNLSIEENHVAARQALVRKFAREDAGRSPYETPLAESVWLRPMATGGNQSEYHHVFIPREWLHLQSAARAFLGSNTTSNRWALRAVLTNLDRA